MRLPKKQVKFYLEPELYEKLSRIAKEQGVSVPSLVRNLVLELLGVNKDGNLASRVADLEAKYEQLAREVGRMEIDIAMILKRCCRSGRS